MLYFLTLYCKYLGNDLIIFKLYTYILEIIIYILVSFWKQHIHIFKIIQYIYIFSNKISKKMRILFLIQKISRLS